MKMRSRRNVDKNVFNVLFTKVQKFQITYLVLVLYMISFKLELTYKAFTFLLFGGSIYKKFTKIQTARTTSRNSKSISLIQRINDSFPSLLVYVPTFNLQFD